MKTLKKKNVLLFVGLILSASMLWLGIGPRIMADITPYGSYSERNYEYRVEIDYTVNSQQVEVETDGILVGIDPKTAKGNPSKFSAAYLEEADGRLNRWANENYSV